MESAPPLTATRTVAPRGTRSCSRSKARTSVMRVGGCVRGIEGPLPQLEPLTQFKVLALERASPRYRRVLEGATLGAGLEMRAVVASESECVTPCLVAQLVVDRRLHVHAFRTRAMTRRRLARSSGFSRHGLATPSRKARARCVDAPPVMKTMEGMASGASRSASA